MFKGLTITVLAAVIGVSLFAVSCKKDMVRDETTDNTVTDAADPIDSTDTIDESYLKEGYLPSKDIYRSIILAPKSSEKITEDEIRKKAENKFISGIQNKLKEKGIICDRNKRVEILRIIENDSILSKKENVSKTDVIYYFDIKNFKSNMSRIMCEQR